MEITIGDLAICLKKLIPKFIPETYDVDGMFLDVATDEKIRSGVLAFREFLYRLCDVLASDDAISGITKKGKKKFSDETTLTVEFPFVNNIKSILINAIQYGMLSETGDALLIKDWTLLSLKRSHNKHSTTKISVPQMLKALRVLSACGMHFEGVDLNSKKPDIDVIEITYSDDPLMLIGWQALGRAQLLKSSRHNDDILLRCDYRMLQTENKDVSSFLETYLEPLSNPLKELVLDFHEHYSKMGVNCDVELGSLCLQLVYYYKKKPLWRFSSSLNNGYRLVVKTKNTSRYEQVIESFPKDLSEFILKGYGCDRKAGTGHGNCQKGCEGYRFSLDHSLIEMRDNIMQWLDHEILSMQTRKKRGK